MSLIDSEAFHSADIEDNMQLMICLPRVKQFIALFLIFNLPNFLGLIVGSALEEPKTEHAATRKRKIESEFAFTLVLCTVP